MTNDEHNKTKDVLDDKSMDTWIREVPVLPLNNEEASRFDQMAGLLVPQQAFGRSDYGANNIDDPDADLLSAPNHAQSSMMAPEKSTSGKRHRELVDTAGEVPVEPTTKRRYASQSRSTTPASHLKGNCANGVVSLTESISSSQIQSQPHSAAMSRTSSNQSNFSSIAAAVQFPHASQV